MNANSTASVVVEGGGTQVVAHVGLHALGALADRLGLGDSLSARIPMVAGHDRGKVVVHAMLMLAGGGEACSDIEALRAQPALFGSVPSDSTLYRSFRKLDADVLAGLWEAMAEVRAEVWRRSAPTTGADEVVLDIDASLVEIHSEHKVGTAPTYKGGFGFHPIFCFADATGEALAARLRPGNATANAIADNLGVLDDAVAQLPAEVAAGHHPGEDAAQVGRPLRVRTDSAGCSARFATACRERNIGFSVVARSSAAIHAAISAVADDEDRWSPALGQDGNERPGSAVAELTEFVQLSGWPEGTRLIVRREPLHPGAQTSLFPSLEFRYWGHYTDGRCRGARPRHAGPCPCRGPHPPEAGLGARALPLRRPRRQPGLAGRGVLRRRPGALVPAAVPQRGHGHGRAQGAALGHLAHPRPCRSPSSQERGAHPR